MQFHAVITNPPYQKMDGGAGASSIPIYQLFVQQAQQLSPAYLSMIIPSRWFTDGKGLNQFRADMLGDRHLSFIFDYSSSEDCFPDTGVSGGICYFLWERDKIGNCCFVNMGNNESYAKMRRLNANSIFIRSNRALSIVNKVQQHLPPPERNSCMAVSSMISVRAPFGLRTYVRGESEPCNADDVKVYSSRGTGYLPREAITKNIALIDEYKVMVGCIVGEFAGLADSSGQHKVLGKTQLLSPGEICTESYLIAHFGQDRIAAFHFLEYIHTKFTRFLILQTLSGIHVGRDKYALVPVQDFSMSWTDETLYAKYDLSPEEISLIESTIKPM